MISIQAFKTHLLYDRIYNCDTIIEPLKYWIKYETLAKKKIEYIDIASCFDIETSSFYMHGKKYACMYIWTMSINGFIVQGRTWQEFIRLLNNLTRFYDLNENRRFVIYVHNLEYEFQFMRRWLQFINVFAINNRVPLYALTIGGIEFRCSYLLTGYKLATVAKNLTNVRLKKLVGDLDYTLIRHSKTLIDTEENAYCINDVQIVAAHIIEESHRLGSFLKIPLTMTGYVRHYTRDHTIYKDGIFNSRYRDIIKNLTLEVSEYQQLRHGFAGGYVHSNCYYFNDVVKDCDSEDLTSDYPSQCVKEQFPMSNAEVVTIRDREELKENLKYYCCLFDVEFTNIRSTLGYEFYISRSKCWVAENATCYNGRVVSADRICLTVTEQDFLIISKTYKCDNFRIANFKRYMRGYLPTELVDCILTFYEDKTKLKGVKGMEQEYMYKKQLLNAIYGMMVTDIIRDKIKYDNQWLPPEEADMYAELQRYNYNPNRFLFYPWGVWVTAYARRDLWSAIVALGNDYIYSDTDSVKGVNFENHANYFEEYNNIVELKLRRAMSYHGFSFDRCQPEDINGDKHMLGLWDHDGKYKRFKALGAKRYMYEDEKGKLSITVSGLNKKVATPWLQETFADPFEAFDHDLKVPGEKTGKLTHTYIDDEFTIEITDYRGVTAEVHEKSYIHLEPAEYHLSTDSIKDVIDFVKGVEYL